MKISVNNIIVGINKGQNNAILQEIVARGIKKNNIEQIIWTKRSIDSRNKNSIKFIYNVDVLLKENVDISKCKNITLAREVEKVLRVPIFEDKNVAVIGCGPAGMFAALRLCEYGYTPHIFERGECIDKRNITTENFVKNGTLDPNSNIQFGEGGAGTYSDGKLNTRIKSENIYKIFDTFVECGANPQILWDYKPHIGTDELRKVIKNLREKIIKMGGKFYFNHKLEDLIIENERVVGLKISHNNKSEIYNFSHTILAIGHSARDIYRMLHSHNVAMASKPFAMGTRIEHPANLIDEMQYGKFAPNMERATYNFTYNKDGRGVFSFCMCPGGEIVNATSNYNTNLVNGMSYSGRNGKFSNSAIVVGIKENDFGDELFSGMEFQEKLEKKAYNVINEYGGIYQNLFDFMNNKKTTHQIESSYKMPLNPYNLNNFFPEIITNYLQMAFNYWSKNKFFINREANLIAPETRTSAPVKILRDVKCESINIRGLYPIGEGSGYAGGITSACVDGIKVVDLAFCKII